jgi:tetratricopeptide (TPR) repeat protein
MLTNFSLKALVIVASLSAGGFSLCRLLDSMHASRTMVAYENFKQQNQTRNLYGQKGSMSSEEFVVDFKEIIKSPTTDYRERSMVARYFAELAEQTTDANLKIDYLCKTLAALTASLKKQPLRSRTLVTWSNVRQLLGSYSCPGEPTLYGASDFRAALELAKEAEPQDQQALFNAGLVLLWSDDRRQAFPLFRRVLELGSDSSKLQREFIYSLVSDKDSLASLIPPKFPQVIELAEYLKANSSANSNGSSVSIDLEREPRILWEFYARAIKDFSSRYELGEIDTDIYRSRLLQMWSLSRESAVLPVLDKLLADLMRQKSRTELAVYFSSRSQFLELPIISGFKNSDFRPEKSALAGWGENSTVRLDNFFSSVGFYLPRSTTLRRIELHSVTQSSHDLSGLLRVLQSDDNTTWEDITGVCSLFQVTLEGRSIVYIDIPGSTKRFWKVHYASPGRPQTFLAGLESMIRVFGIGAKIMDSSNFPEASRSEKKDA